jgi:hypothetical protein
MSIQKTVNLFVDAPVVAFNCASLPPRPSDVPGLAKVTLPPPVPILTRYVPPPEGVLVKKAVFPEPEFALFATPVPVPKSYDHGWAETFNGENAADYGKQRCVHCFHCRNIELVNSAAKGGSRRYLLC